MFKTRIFLDINELGIKCSEDESHFSEMVEEKEEFFSLWFIDSLTIISVPFHEKAIFYICYVFFAIRYKTYYLFVSQSLPYSFLILSRFEREEILFFFFEEPKKGKRSLP